MGPDHLQDIVDEAARLSGAPVTLEDREFNLVAFCSHNRAGDAVRQDSILTRRSTPQVRAYFESFGIARAIGPLRIPPDPHRGLLGRICIPVRWQSVTYGYLWLLEDGRPIATELLPELAATAGRVGVEMARRSRLRDDLGWKVGDLLSTYPETRARAAEEIAESWALSVHTPVAAVCVEAAATPVNAWRLPRTVLVGSDQHASTFIVPLEAEGDLSAARTVARAAFDALASPSRPGESLAATPRTTPSHIEASRVGHSRSGLSPETRSRHGSHADPPLHLAPAVSARAGSNPVSSAATPARVVAGIGGGVGSLALARESWLQARIAARVAASLRSEYLVLEWPDLGVHRLLAVGADAALREALSTPGVARLLAEGDAELLHTATAYLDEAGSAQRAAAALGVHRQTLYHRLQKIERLSGLDLGSGRDRLQLHLALTLLPAVAD
jgi:hypothetical protein